MRHILLSPAEGKENVVNASHHSKHPAHHIEVRLHDRASLFVGKRDRIDLVSRTMMSAADQLSFEDLDGVEQSLFALMERIAVEDRNRQNACRVRPA